MAYDKQGYLPITYVGKYGRIITKFVRELTHPTRIEETELGDLYADALRETLGLDIMLLGSGSIRTEKLGPVVSKKDFDENFPYNDGVFVTYWTGKQLKQGLLRMLWVRVDSLSILKMEQRREYDYGRCT